MQNDETGRLLEEIGQILAQDTEYRLDGTFLYAEVETAMVNPSIFKDLGNRILYRWAGNDLCSKLLDLWEAEDPDKRWATIQYTIDGGKFDALFTFPEELDPDEGTGDRRERVLQRRYGDKPIDYPSLETDDAPDS